MANGDFFDAFLRGGSNYNGGEPPYYEDTHDANGNYTGPSRGFAPQQNPQPTTPPYYGAQQAQPSYTPPPQPQYQNNATGYTPPPTTAHQRTEYNLGNPPRFAQVPPPNTNPQPIPLPNANQYIPPQLNQNFVVYQPRSTADVEQLIAYLRRREPALVDLDPIADSPDAQRLMDFISGAAYALGDGVLTIRRNLFLITPDTIDVLKPESEK
ncbi:MAG: cell division protein SepF [Clostridiales bacterium]|nr:cell division protein SepF [Clostridiales bacterium]